MSVKVRKEGGVIAFGIMGWTWLVPVEASPHCYSIIGKLLLYHPQVVLQLVNFFCCRPCFLLYFNNFASHSFFFFSLNRKVTGKSKGQGLSEGGYPLVVVTNHVSSAINSTSTLPSNNFLPSLKLGCCI